MKKYFQTLIIFASILILFSCMETKQDYTLNPDGSGKVIFQARFQPMKLGMGKDKDPAEEMKRSVSDILQKSEGVTTWEDVSYELTDDGRIHFKGTAFFKDINKLKFHNLSMIKAEFKKSPKGGMVLVIKGDEKKKEGSAGKPSGMTEEEIQQAIKKEKMSYQQSKPMMSAILSGMKMEASFRLPGNIARSINFLKEKNDILSIVFDGKKFMDVMDKIMEDDNYIRQFIVEGKKMDQSSPLSDHQVNKMMYGEEGPVQANIAGQLKPLFNYKTEVARAKKDYPAMLKKLDLDETLAPAKPARGGKFKALKVAGVRIVNIADWDRNIRAFHADQGYTLSLVGDLPGAILKVTGGKLEKAVANNNENLMPEKEWDRDIKFPSLSKDNKAIIFEVMMKLPGKNVKYIKDVSGYLEYISSGGTSKMDVGLTEFKEGVKGTSLGSEILSIKEDQWKKGSYVMELKMDIENEALKEVTFYDDAGQKMDVYRLGYSSQGTKSTVFSFSLNGAFPAKGRIQTEIYKDLGTFRVPFSLKKISLTGKKL
ncbi:MAG: hypothetical protein JW827_08575 [Spirochaetes bacterium]|nr:hypothetical protein [Spirochaetota bacterium]